MPIFNRMGHMLPIREEHARFQSGWGARRIFKAEHMRLFGLFFQWFKVCAQGVRSPS
jgi:hypothetical protein